MPEDRSENFPKPHLSQAKRELFTQLLAEHGILREPRKAIEAGRYQDQPPLSFGQEQLWFLNELQPGSAVYSISRAHRLFGSLSVDALTQSFNRVIHRHAILRTTFSTNDGRPVQVIAPTLQLQIPVLDLTHYPVQLRESEISRLIITQAQEPFDLLRGPLVRVTLIYANEGEWILVFSVHQIICDGQSITLLHRELESLYSECLGTQTPCLPELSIQYSDYACCQRDELEGQRLRSLLEFWQARFAAPPSPINLPTDRARPKIQSFTGSRYWLHIDEDLTADLKELSEQKNISLFVLLFAIFATLIKRYGGQDDIVLGVPISNRYRPESQHLIGFFVNTLALRLDLSGNPTFKDLLARIRTVCHEAFAHGQLPFEKLVEAVGQTRNLGRNPLFHVMFAMQEPGNEELKLHGLRTEALDVENGTSKFDLMLSLQERNQKLLGSIEYSADLFTPETIQRVAAHFQSLANGVVADPGKAISTLPILTEAERYQILIEWNDTAADYPKDKCIHHLFEEQVESTPEAIAIEFEDLQITYRELNCRANQLARYLISLGIGPEKLVGICVERSIEMVVGLLGILKAGGAYVPLDPAYPKERLQFMLEDSQVSVLLTQQKLLQDQEWTIDDDDAHPCSFEPGRQVVCLDRDRPTIEQQSKDNSSQSIGSQKLAYVIYTSGSTGKPKGVQIEHRSVVNCLIAIAKQIDLSPQNKWLAVTTISFDIAALELFSPLIAGNKLVIANSEESRDATRLIAQLKTSEANVMQATPSMWQLLFETGWQCPAGFTILSGGEALTHGLADRFLDGANSVWNLYGPTESTIWSTMARVTANESTVPIGRPIANTQVYILDSNLQPVPIGVPGDLYIGGDGLARGYLNRPELTAEKFVRNSFNDDPHSRLYRTGDLAKYRPDGNIEFVGRYDNQVKIRGHRIELGEIETILNQHPSVKETVIVSRVRDLSEEKELAAYVVVSNEPTPTVAELRGFLQERVPEFMIPSIFMFLDVLPLMPNGKIDRDALPSPDGERSQLDPAFVEPRTEIEELVAQIWRELLKRDRIGVYDNFFELGGHSLLATRVVARLQNNFQVDFPLRKLFELPTVAGLAEYIDKLRRSSAGTSIMPIVRANRHQALPLSFSQRRLWYLQKVDPNLSAYNIPAAFRIRGDLDSSALEQALNDLTARHEILRSCFKEIDGQPFQESAPDLRMPLPVNDLSNLSQDQAEAEANRLFHADARQLYNLSTAPLLRAALVKLAADDYVLILNFHHIIADGSSLAIFYRELAFFYDATSDAKKVTLPPLPIQYADFAAWQHDWLGSDAFEIQIAYWKHQLADLPAPVELPKDFDRPVLLSYRGARLTRQLSEQSTDLLKTFSRHHSTTLFITLFATFNILLSRITGREDIVVGSTIAGRNRAETESLIGFFINALPLRTDVSGDPSLSTLLQRVREICLDAYSHQEMPFEKLVEELRPPRDPGHNPIFDILFNVADTSERTLALPGCDIVKLPPPAPEAKFDIVLHAPEIAGKIELVAVYNTALFREERIALILEQWATLLEQATRTPELPIRELSLVTDSSRALLPDPTEVLDKKWEGAIHEILSEQARRSPDSIAVIDLEERWTYREIDETSDRLAHAVIAAGVEPKDTVAIYAGRNASLVITIFGVLKAGASFLILDPAYPSARTFDYLRIAQPKGWLQGAGTGEPEALPNYLDNLDLACRIIIPQAKSDLLKAFSAVPAAKVEITVDPDSPAYIAFTSGSTGEPKGVICRHGPITHFLPWQQEAFGLAEDDRFAMLSGLAYSHLHRDVFTAIHLGATVYIPSPSEARSPDQLANWLKHNAITVLHLTPALGELLVTSIETRLPSVRRVFFGGDILPMSEVVQIRELAPNAIVGSFYGATETQRAVGYYEITDDDILDHEVSNKTAPLGRGIKDVQLLVLNKSGQLAGIGELGDVFVRSPHLAAGYVGDHERTQRMFINNPFTHDPTDRLYRTGELGRYMLDGKVECAGRNDRRINIRGFRVELEEIEVMLKQHPAVKNAAVVLQESDENGPDNQKSKTQNPKSDRRLVAYVAADEEPQSLKDLLHYYLSARLPDYMLPAHLVILTSLPLSPNGKIDYRALPPMRFSADDTATAPRNEIEVKLQAIFAEVLGRPDIGIDDNFFRMGGHSLLAARAAVRIGDAFGVNLALSAFLEMPTISALALRVASLLPPGQISTKSDKDDREEFDL